MKISAVLVVLSVAAGAVADLHLFANCFSRIQPIGNPNTCNKKRYETLWDREPVVKRSYADNAAATTKACQAYRNRNTGTQQWDTCPDCTVGQRPTSDPAFCVTACNSAAKHIGGDEWNFYCQQNGADGGDAY